MGRGARGRAQRRWCSRRLAVAAFWRREGLLLPHAGAGHTALGHGGQRHHGGTRPASRGRQPCLLPRRLAGMASRVGHCFGGAHEQTSTTALPVVWAASSSTGARMGSMCVCLCLGPSFAGGPEREAVAAVAAMAAAVWDAGAFHMAAAAGRPPMVGLLFGGGLETRGRAPKGRRCGRGGVRLTAVCRTGCAGGVQRRRRQGHAGPRPASSLFRS